MPQKRLLRHARRPAHFASVAPVTRAFFALVVCGPLFASVVSSAPAPAPAQSVTPSFMIFGSVAPGATSVTQGLQITNSAAVAVTLANPPVIATSGEVSDFLITSAPVGTTGCAPGMSLPPGTSCSFGVQFRPQAGGVRTAYWNVHFNDGAAPLEVSLQGTAVAAAAATSSSSSAPASGTGAGGGALGSGTLLGLLLGCAAGMRRNLRRYR